MFEVKLLFVSLVASMESHYGDTIGDSMESTMDDPFVGLLCGTNERFTTCGNACNEKKCGPSTGWFIFSDL